MKLWIDGDSFTSFIRPIVKKAIEKRSIHSILVTNGNSSPPKGPWKIEIVAGTADAADNLILEQSSVSDLVITRDIPLAEQLVKRGISTINDRGMEFDLEWIGERRSLRDLHLNWKKTGLVLEKKENYSEKDKQAFANCFDRVLTRLLKNDKKKT